MSRSGMKTPISKVSKQHSADPGSLGSNPFDSDSESDLKPARTSSAPLTATDERRGASSSSSYSYSSSSAAKNKYRNDFRDLGGFENQSVQELENYAVYKAEETTQKVNNCLKIAEGIREDGTRTLVTLHQQGEQITRTHQIVADTDQDLSRGEKPLGSLGGIFSKTWKPKKSRPIKGPVLLRDDSFKRKGSHAGQRERSGLSSSPKGRLKNRQCSSEPTSSLGKVEVEKMKQDDTLSDLSNILGQLKDMAVDMGSEIERQNKALDHLDVDAEVLVDRVKGANRRGRRLLGK